MEILSADIVAGLVRSGDTVLIGGSGGGHAVAEALIEAVERRFLSEGQPRGITSLHPVGIGDGKSHGVNRFAHAGLLKRIVCGTLVNSPLISDLVIDGKVEGYTLPQGALSQLMREMAAGRTGLLTETGLNTFVDPRQAGGRQGPKGNEDLVELITIGGQERLLYKPFHVDVCFLRGTSSDPDGNVTMEEEAVFGEMLSQAQATRRCGGLVVVQVKRIVGRDALPPKAVKIPGILVDIVTLEPNQSQTYETRFSAAYAGQTRVPLSDIPKLAFGPRAVVARRAALELFPGAICNLGSGISTSIANIAAEEEVLEDICLTNEQGLIGGAPASGNEAGASRNYSAMIDQPYQFDFYDGGGLDIAFLSFAEVDASGNVNVSRLGRRIIGPGGFINIAQHAKTVVFSGMFVNGAIEIEYKNAKMSIAKDGARKKFVETVEQITFSGSYAGMKGQKVLYVTERAVFRLRDGSIELVEIAPGADLDRDIIQRMAFCPRISPNLKPMNERLFRAGRVGLANVLADRAPRSRHERLAEKESRAEPPLRTVGPNSEPMTPPEH
jgi:propionate CoA-transferase